MFSDQMRRVDDSKSRVVLVVAAGVAFACLLLGMAMVADGQVKKAQLRKVQLTAQNVALATCFETREKFGRQQCLSRLQTEELPDLVNAGAAEQASAVGAAGVVAPTLPGTGLVDAVFVTR